MDIEMDIIMGIHSSNVARGFMIRNIEDGHDYVSGEDGWILHNHGEYVDIEIKEGIYERYRISLDNIYICPPMVMLDEDEEMEEMERMDVNGMERRKRGRPCKTRRNKRNATAYNLFVREKMMELKRIGKIVDNHECMRECARLWRLSKEEKHSK